MRVFNLCCHREHAFEGWFASSEAFESQLQSSLIACPMCESTKIEKRLHAPYVNRGSHRLESTPSESAAKMRPASAPALPADVEQIAMTAHAPELRERIEELRIMFAKHVRETTVNVGERFAEEARAMHYNEKPHMPIRGRASPEETAELVEEGITILPLPFSVELPELQ